MLVYRHTYYRLMPNINPDFVFQWFLKCLSRLIENSKSQKQFLGGNGVLFPGFFEQSIVKMEKNKANTFSSMCLLLKIKKTVFIGSIFR